MIHSQDGASRDHQSYPRASRAGASAEACTQIAARQQYISSFQIRNGESLTTLELFSEEVNQAVFESRLPEEHGAYFSGGYKGHPFWEAYLVYRVLATPRNTLLRLVEIKRTPEILCDEIGILEETAHEAYVRAMCTLACQNTIRFCFDLISTATSLRPTGLSILV